MSFAELELLTRLSEDSVLSKIDRLLDWQPVRTLIKGLYQRETKDKGGQQPYDSLVMFSAITPALPYLPHPELAQALRVRLVIRLDQISLPLTACRWRSCRMPVPYAGSVTAWLRRISCQAC